jgi:PPPDE putative peptidase domain
MLAFGQYHLQFVASGLGVQDGQGYLSFGHTFMIVTMPTRTGVKEESFGFYAATDAKGKEPSLLRMVVGTPGALNSEWRRNPERLAHSKISFDMPITYEQRKAIYIAMSKWNEHKYQLTNENCIDFVDSVARSVGRLKPPFASAIFLSVSLL